MPATQGIWGSGSAIYYDKDGRRTEAYIVARYDQADPNNPHLNIDLWGKDGGGRDICDTKHRFVPKKHHFMDIPRPVEIILNLDDEPLKTEITPQR